MSLKLYYLPGACSLASHISLIEAGVAFTPVAVDRQKRTSEGGDYLAVTAKGYVPALVLESGEVLTESAALLPYIGTLNPASDLIPAAGTLGYFRVTEWCAYMCSEVHKNHTALFKPGSTDEQKEAARAAVLQRYAFIESTLGDKPYLTGDAFTVADAYLYVTLSWAARVAIDLTSVPKVAALFERAKARASVIAARQAEGLPA